MSDDAGEGSGDVPGRVLDDGVAAEPRVARSRSREFLSIYLKGVAMGAADTVPGVSGGTIALITGIYERLVDAIAGLAANGVELLSILVRGPEHDGSGRVRAIRRTARAVDLPFLVVLGLGVLSGIATLANVVHVALEAYRAATFAFFFGIILASPLVLRREVSLREPRHVAAGLLGVLFAFVVSGLQPRAATYGLPALFFIGAVAICAMVLPGISGSLLLLVIGAYDTMTGAVSDLTSAVAGLPGGGSTEALAEPLSILVVFAAGAAVGVTSFARVVSWSLDAYRAATMTFLVGVMLGALRAPAIEITESIESVTPGVAVGLVAAGLAGAILVVVLEYVTEDLTN